MLALQPKAGVGNIWKSRQLSHETPKEATPPHLPLPVFALLPVLFWLLSISLQGKTIAGKVAAE